MRLETNLVMFPTFSLADRFRPQELTLTGRHGPQHGKVRYRYHIHQSNEGMTIPGPTAKRLWMGLLANLEPPISGMVRWRWRPLLKKLGLTVSGRAVAAAQDALKAIAGLRIESDHALLQDRQPVTAGGIRLIEHLDIEEQQLILPAWLVRGLGTDQFITLDFSVWSSLSPLAARLYEIARWKLYSHPTWDAPLSWLRRLLPSETDLTEALVQLVECRIISSYQATEQDVVLVRSSDEQPRTSRPKVKKVEEKPQPSRSQNVKKQHPLPFATSLSDVEDERKIEQKAIERRRKDRSVSVSDVFGPGIGPFGFQGHDDEWEVVNVIEHRSPVEPPTDAEIEAQLEAAWQEDRFGGEFEFWCRLGYRLNAQGDLEHEDGRIVKPEFPDSPRPTVEWYLDHPTEIPTWLYDWPSFWERFKSRYPDKAEQIESI